MISCAVFFAFSLILISSCSITKETRRPSSTEEGHLMFFIHGYTGDKGNFQSLPNILRVKFPKNNFVLLEYPTGSDNKNSDKTKPFDFTRIINSKIIR